MPKQTTESLIQTFSGNWIDPFNFKAEEVLIEDVAAHLSKLCRYTGACLEFYSVAQHSVLVANALEGTPFRLWGLLHDASEAYLGDISNPLKQREEFEFYREAEERAMHAVAQRFLLDEPMPEAVKRADNVACVTEFRDQMRVNEPRGIEEDILPLTAKITPWHPKKAQEQFMYLFHDLTRGLSI